MFSSAEAQVSTEDGVRFTFDSGGRTSWPCLVTGELNPERRSIEFNSVGGCLCLCSVFVLLILNESDLLSMQVLDLGSSSEFVEVSGKVLLPRVHADVLHEKFELALVFGVNGNGDNFNLLCYILLFLLLSFGI